MSEHQMVLAFLRAEIDSPRFGPTYEQLLGHHGHDRSLIDEANLDSPDENTARLDLLSAVRGYKRNQFLFRGFPDDAVWRQAILLESDFQHLLYANYPTWLQLSSGSRLVTDGARNINLVQVGEDANANIWRVAEALRAGNRYPELIAAELPSGLVVVEGHARATAYCLMPKALAEGVPAFVAHSSSMRGWVYA